jgi:hypothetical protein
VLPDSSEDLGLAGRNTDLVCCHLARHSYAVDGARAGARPPGK